MLGTDRIKLTDFGVLLNETKDHLAGSGPIILGNDEIALSFQLVFPSILTLYFSASEGCMKKKPVAPEKGKNRRISFFVKRIFGQFRVEYIPPSWLKKRAKAPTTLPEMEPQSRKAPFLSFFRKASSSCMVLLRKLRPFFDLSGRRSLIGYGAVAAVLAILVVAAALIPKPHASVDLSLTPPGTDPAGGESRLPLYIEFSGSAARIDLVGKDLPSGASISPGLPGKWVWSSDKELVFFPSEAWPIGGSYRVSLDEAIFSDLVRVRRRSAAFETASFTASLSDSQFYIDPVNQDNRRVTASVSFSHLPDRSQFEKSVDMGGPFTVSYDPDGLRAHLVSAPLAVPDKGYKRSIRLRGKVSAAAGGRPAQLDEETSVDIPGRYEYGYIQEIGATIVREPSYEYRKLLTVELSLGIAPETLGKGLSVYLLPKDRPEAPGTAKEEDHEWSTSEIDPALLAKSRRLALTSLPIEGEYGKAVQFSFEAPSGRYLYVKQTAELSFMGDYRSHPGLATIVRVPAIPREVRIMHDGSILSLSGEKKISLFANDIGDVQFEIGRIIPDQVNHFISQTEGDYKNPQFESWDFGLENLSSIHQETMHLNRLEPGKLQYFSFDFAKYLGREMDPRMKYGLFSFKVSEYDLGTKKAGEASSKRFILVTDLGLLVKRSEQSGYDVFVQSVHSGNPVAGATVEVIGKNGLVVLTQQTDGVGRVHFPSLAGFLREKSPVAFVAKKDSDMSFLPVKGNGRFLNYSRFDVGGIYGSADPGFIDAYLFSDRGIYRPGDELHVGAIVKAGSWSRSLKGLPLEIAVEDPRGLEVQRKKILLSASGFEEFSWRSLDSAPTGKYEVKLYLSRDKDEKRLLGSTSVKIEEFRPDRLSIRSRFLNDQGLAWMPLANLKAEVSLMNLYGTPATGNLVRAGIVLSPATLSLSAYQGYRFFDPYLSGKTVEESLGEAKTDASGKVNLGIDLSRFEKATFRLRLQAEGLEKEGGRSVATESSVIVSPLSSIVGYKASGDLSYINAGAGRMISFIAIDPAQHSVALDGLTLRITESRYVSILEKGADELYHYRSVEKKIPVSSRPASIGPKGLDIALPTANPGDFELVLEDALGVKLSSLVYSVVGAANASRSLDKNAELQVKLDKADYANGETIKVNIKAPYVGAGLISIERDKVYACTWFRADTSASVQTITVPEGLEGTAYVNVSFVRDIGSHDIYSSPLSYGVVPFSISRARRSNRLSLSVPEEAAGGSRLRVVYSSARPGKMVLFAVDEGILQVAKYQSPRPLDHFFEKRALEVETSQILDLILPEYSIVRAASAMGGDDEGPSSNLNPFKRKNKPPVAFWSGIRDCGPEKGSVEFDLPPWYNGTVKIMAVVVSDDSIGTAERETVVRNDFVITPSVPPVLSPGDEFEVGVSVMNDWRGSSGKAEVQLRLAVSSESLQLLQAPVATASLARGEEKTFFFRLKVKQTLGEARIDFIATGGKSSSSLWETMSIRPALPYRVELASGRLAKGSKELALGRSMHEEFRKVEARSSYLPIGLAGGLKEYLDNFPYGCTEQIISRSFPFLSLSSIPEFGIDRKTALDSFLAAQRVLAARQNSSGAFGLWAANDEAPLFISAYGAHYLTEAREAGMPVDQDLLSRALQGLRSALESDADLERHDARSAAYAIYVLTRNGVVTTNYINGLLSSKHLPRGWRSGPTAAYLLGAYALMHEEREAESLLDSSFAGRAETDDPFYGSLASSGLCLFMASRHLPSRMGRIASSALEDMVAAIGESKYNTLSSSYAILGLCAYSKAAGAAPAGSLGVFAKLPSGKYESLGFGKGLIQKRAVPSGSTAVKFEEKSGMPLYYQVVQAGFDLDAPSSPERHGIEVFREYTDAAGQPVKSVGLGSLVYVHVKIRSVDPKRKEVPNLAIVDLLPAGFELSGGGSGEGSVGSGSLAPSFVEPREDRVLIFCGASDSVKEYVYSIKATARGAFSIPPAFAESMYDLSIWSMQPKAGSIVVTGETR